MHYNFTLKNAKTLRVHYTREGKGAPLLLLHGWGQNLSMMRFISDHFKSRFEVVNIDLPGFGESEEPPVSWDIQAYAQFLRQLLELFHLSNPSIVAHSFGARIALYYASMYPVNKLCLTGAAGIKKPRNIAYYGKVYLYKLLKHFKKQVSMGSSDFQNASDTMRGVLVKSVEEDLRVLLKQISCETLLVWGENDEATPLWMGEVMEKEMMNATLIVLEHDDHFAYFHQPQRFIAILEYFL